MRKALLALVFCLLSNAAFADSSNGFGFISTNASGPQCKQIVAAPVTLVGFSMGNFTTTGAILTFYDALLANTSTAVSYPYPIPANATANIGGGSNVFPSLALNFLKALTFCVNTVSGNNSASSGLLQGTISFH